MVLLSPWGGCYWQISAVPLNDGSSKSRLLNCPGNGDQIFLEMNFVVRILFTQISEDLSGYRLIIIVILKIYQFSLVQPFNHVQLCHPMNLQHAKPPCPSSTPRVHPNPCALSRWCHPIISSSVVPFSSCPQSFPASGSFPMSQLFTSDGQSIGVSAWTSVLPMNTQGWSPLEWTGPYNRDLQDFLQSVSLIWRT